MSAEIHDVLRELDSACRYLFPDRPPHKAFEMAKALIEALQSDRIAMLTALCRINSLDEKNIAKYSKQIANEAIVAARNIK